MLGINPRALEVADWTARRVDLVTRLVPVTFASLLAVIRDPAGAPTLLEGTVNSRVRLQVRD